VRIEPTNRPGGLTTGDLGQNYAYPEASHAEREQIIQKHYSHHTQRFVNSVGEVRNAEKFYYSGSTSAACGLVEDTSTLVGYFLPEGVISPCLIKIGRNVRSGSTGLDEMGRATEVASAFTKYGD